MASKVMSSVPLATSFKAPEVERYGMCTMKLLVRDLKYSPRKWVPLPGPELP